MKAKWNLLIVFVLMVSTLVGGKATLAQAEGETGHWDGQFFRNGTDGWVSTLVASGNDVYLGGQFATAGNALSYSLVKWTGSAWATVSGGSINREVTRLAVGSDGTLYAAYEAHEANDYYYQYIARVDATAWTVLNIPTHASVEKVTALEVGPDGSLYAAFYNTSSDPAYSELRKWDGGTGTSWTTIGRFPDGKIYDLAFRPGTSTLYVGGEFTSITDDSGSYYAFSLAEWDGGWSNSINEDTLYWTVMSLAFDANNNLYVGGKFAGIYNPDGSSPALNNIARLNLSDGTWYPIGGGLPDASGGVISWVNGVNSLVLGSGGAVYAGYNFMDEGYNDIAIVARWDGTNWNLDQASAGGSMRPGDPGSEDIAILSLALGSDGSLYAAGMFGGFGTTQANNVARWTFGGWTAVGPSGNGVNSYIEHVEAAGNGQVYAGGRFTQAGSVVVSKLALWTGSAWSSLDTSALPPTLAYYSFTVDPNRDTLYLGVGNESGGTIYEGESGSWTPLPDLGNPPYAMAVAPNGTLYALYDAYDSVNSVDHYKLARYGADGWTNLGEFQNTNSNASVDFQALKVDSSGNVYVAGGFNQVVFQVDIPAAVNNIAKWDAATSTWSALGDGISGEVTALALGADGSVYAASQIEGVPTVQRWGETSWTLLPSLASSGYIRALLLNEQGTLWAAGYFKQTDPQINNIAKLEQGAAAWAPLGSGIDAGLYGFVSGLASDGAGGVYACGDFRGAGGKASIEFAHWIAGAQPLALGPDTIAGGNVNAAYSQQFTASGGAVPYTFSKTGALPNGLTFTPDGLLSGTPTQSGSFPITIKVTDASQQSATKDYTLVIGKAIPTITLTSSKNPSIAGSAITFKVTVSGYDKLAPTGTVTFTDVTYNEVLPGCGAKSLNKSAANCAATIYFKGSYTIRATYSGDANYAAGTYAEMTQVVNPASANLGLTMTGSKNPVRPSSPLVYTLTVSNAGPNTAAFISVVDTLPVGVTNVTYTVPTGWSCGLDNGVVGCSTGETSALASGAKAIIKITVTTPAAKGTLTNTATVSSANTDDPSQNNNTATVTTTVK